MPPSHPPIRRRRQLPAPEASSSARRFAAGTITREQLTAAEDTAIADLVEKEKQAG